MKSTSLLILLGLLPLIGACERSATGAICTPKHVTVTKKAGGQYSPASLAVHPAIVRVREGCSFDIYFSGGALKTTKGPGWLNKDSGASPVTVNVPVGAAESPYKDYKYDLELVGFGKLDPRARVTH